MNVSVKRKTKIPFENIVSNYMLMGKRRTLIGIPSTTAPRDIGLSNAAIGYIQEKGSPAAHIPPRPFLIPGVQAAQLTCKGFLRDSAAETLTDISKLQAALDMVGLKAAASVVDMFTSNDWTPLAPRTIYQRMKKLSSANAERYMAGTAGFKPLIDTGQLRRSITYVIR